MANRDKGNGSSSPSTDSIQRFIHSFKQHMKLTVAQDIAHVTDTSHYRAFAHAVRDRIISRWIDTQKTYYRENPKRVYYFSLEYLMGRTLGNALLNLDLSEIAQEALDELGISLEEVTQVEPDAGLGNGGLGRLAACFLDSMATLQLPACGYGIRYEYGIFRQSIENQQQCESPDAWLRYGNIWEFPRSQAIQIVRFYGRTHTYHDSKGRIHTEWVDTEEVIALPNDVPIPGYKTDTVNTLKLWSACSSHEFNLATFNAGDYVGAVIDSHQSEVISKVLYPNDNCSAGQELRLKQQYFMVAASLQDILIRFARSGNELDQLHEKVVIQLNDTHPSIAIPELMRLLIDDHDFCWDDAWQITTHTFAYTNHTVLPEALEVWPIDLIARVLPRHMEIIYEINRRFLDEVDARFPGDLERRQRMSIIVEGEPKSVRMAHLAIVGSFSINGVAELHSRLLREQVFRDFYEFTPERFNNKTNGITPRRWLRKANPKLSEAISRRIGSGWVKDLDLLREIEAFADDETLHAEWQYAKANNKKTLAAVLHERCGVLVDPDSIFDVQVKRIHEYKRQLLNVMHIITLYNRIRAGEIAEPFTPRTFLFSGKAAPGYVRAKQIIHLINAVADRINRDPAIGDRLKVVFLPNYDVSLAEKIFPGSDLSEQISTAGMEASGTSNMKFALNGALTIGTLDGANIEIMEEVGEENIFIFGNTEDQIAELRHTGYDPNRFITSDGELEQLLHQLRDGFFSPNDSNLFRPIYDSLVFEGDYYCHLPDYRSYVECQARVTSLYQDPTSWTRMAILNVARIGKFSSDRVIRSYAEEIWKTAPCPVNRFHPRSRRTGTDRRAESSG